MTVHLTTFGIPGLDAVPYGLHVCHFYPSREELLDSLIPFFQAGLSNNELCVWIGADPLRAHDIRAAVKNYPDLEAAVSSNQLEILDSAEWYGTSTMNPESIVRRWLQKEEEALERGHQGLRLTGNTSFVHRNDWAGFIEYERLFHTAVQGRRIVANCSYRRLNCEPVDMLEVVSAHDAVLDRSQNGWQVLTKPSLKLTAP